MHCNGWRAIAVTVVAVCAALSISGAAAARVLRVGSYRHHRGPYATIQAAVDAARPGDWVLVGPGDYHERADRRADRGPQDAGTPAGVVITTPGLHLRGMNRNAVIVDGTLPGAGPACGDAKARQDFGVNGDDGVPLGRNGVLVWKTDDVSVENLTVCNFLGGAGSAGNEIWFNGGDGSGVIGLGGFQGSYLNATSTYFDGEDTAATYGLFSSNSRGPGAWRHTYASNFNDAGYYVGACQQVCNQTLDDVHGQYSALGYSGTNSGGSVTVENSEFDHNKTGFDTNSQNNDDAPSPQDGACPGAAISPITHTRSCWVFMHNFVHDNNNPNVPATGTALIAPVGAGMTVSGGRNDTVMDNRFEDNGSWGILFVPFPDTDQPPPVAHCQGGVSLPGVACAYDDSGNSLLRNTFRHNGFFGNATNGDFGELTLTPGRSNCFAGNTEAGGGAVTSTPPRLQNSKSRCGGSALPDVNVLLTNELLCASQILGTPCLPGSHYPRPAKVQMPPLPTSDLPTMPNPCSGVPANAWCPKHKHKRKRPKAHAPA